MGTFTISCPHCAQSLEVQDDWINMEAECPYCKKTFVIASPEAQESSISDPPIDVLNVSSPGNNIDRKEAENLLDAWLASSAGAPIKKISSFLNFDKAAEYPVFILNSKFEIQNREFKPFTAPYRGEIISKEAHIPIASDFWQYESDNQENFDIILGDTLTKRTCHKCGGETSITCPRCRGTGIMTCPDCQGTGELKCDRCEGRGEIDEGGIQSVQKACDWCRGTGEYGSGRCTECKGRGWIYKNEHVPDWRNCPDCGGRGRNRCSVCYGKGEVTCWDCKGTGIICCPVCEGEGELKDGYRLLQNITESKHTAVWCPEKTFPVAEIIKRAKLHRQGQTIATFENQGFCTTVPGGFDAEKSSAIQSLLSIAHRENPEKVSTRFKKHSFDVHELTFIRYEGVEKEKGKHYVFWISSDGSTVIDQCDMFSDFSKAALQDASSESDLIKSLRISVSAYILNRNQHDQIPLKLMNAKLLQLTNLIKMGQHAGMLAGIIGFLVALFACPSIMHSMQWTGVFAIDIVLWFGIGLLALKACRNFLLHALRRSNFKVTMIPPYAVLWGLVCFLPMYYIDVIFLIICTVSHIFLPSIVKTTKKYDTGERKYTIISWLILILFFPWSLIFIKILHFKVAKTHVYYLKEKHTLKAYSLMPILPLLSCILPFGTICAGYIFFRQAGPALFSVMTYSMIGTAVLAAFITAFIALKKYQPCSVDDVKQNGIVIGEEADSDEISLDSADGERPYTLVLNSLGDKPDDVAQCLGKIISYKGLTGKELAGSLPRIIASAPSEEHLLPIRQLLEEEGAQLDIADTTADGSADFLKENPSVKFEKPDKERPYCLMLTSFQDAKKTAAFLMRILGKYGLSEKQLQDSLPLPLASAPTDSALENLRSLLNEIGAVSVIFADEPIETFSLAVTDAGQKQTEVLDFIRKYSMDSKTPDDQLKFPCVMLKFCIQKDVLFCKKRLCELGALAVCADRKGTLVSIENPKIKIADSNEDNPYVLIISSLGKTPDSAFEILKNLSGAFDQQVKIQEKLPMPIASSSSSKAFSELCKDLRAAGCYCMVMNTKTSKGTFGLVVTDLGQNGNRVQEVIEGITHEHVKDLSVPVKVMERITKNDVLFFKKQIEDFGGAAVCVDGNNNEIEL